MKWLLIIRHVNSVEQCRTVSNSVNSINSVNSDNSVNSVNSYSAVLPPSPMVFSNVIEIHLKCPPFSSLPKVSFSGPVPDVVAVLWNEDAICQGETPSGVSWICDKNHGISPFYQNWKQWKRTMFRIRFVNKFFSEDCSDAYSVESMGGKSLYYPNQTWSYWYQYKIVQFI